MNIKKNRKLLIEIGIVTVVIFTVALVFSVVSDLYYTQKVYLTSKNEMIDRDLYTISSMTEEIHNLDWGIAYRKEHSEETGKITQEELFARFEDDEFSNAIWYALYEGTMDPREVKQEYQPYFAFEQSTRVSYVLDNQMRTNHYSKAYIMEITDENEAYVIARGTAADGESPEYGTSMSYKASDHSAVKDILAGKLTAEKGNIYEIYKDKEAGKVYYIGYTPVAINGEVNAVAVLWHDWSAFRKEYLQRIAAKVVIAIVGMVFLNILLMLLLYKKAISPITKIKTEIQEYMNDKDSVAVSENLKEIKVRNEIGVLSDSFSVMATEIDRYINEVRDVTAEKERMSAELDFATRIQADAVPNVFPAFPDRDEFDIHASMDAAKEVGGDFYDFFLVDEDHLALVMADVSGKGVPAALFMMSSKILIKERTMMGGTPAEILDFVNKEICASNKAKMFVTVWLGILELSTGKLIAANGGHEYPAICVNGRYELFEEDAHGMGLGMFKKAKYENYELVLKKDDGIFVYTDGIAEATDAENQLFGTDRMIETLNEAPENTPENTLKAIRTAVDDFVKEAPQFDDLTMLCVKYFGT